MKITFIKKFRNYPKGHSEEFNQKMALCLIALGVARQDPKEIYQTKIMVAEIPQNNIIKKRGRPKKIKDDNPE